LAGKNGAFKGFVIKHLDATLNTDDVETIKKNTSTHCPIGLESTCGAYPSTPIPQ